MSIKETNKAGLDQVHRSFDKKVKTTRSTHEKLNKITMNLVGNQQSKSRSVQARLTKSKNNPIGLNISQMKSLNYHERQL